MSIEVSLVVGRLKGEDLGDVRFHLFSCVVKETVLHFIHGEVEELFII